MNFKFAHNIRVGTHAFISQHVEKIIKKFDLIGCPQPFLRKWILYQLHGNMTEEHYGSLSTIDHCYPLSKTKSFNETDMNNPTHWIILRPMFSIKSSPKRARINTRLYILQEVKAKYFSK